MLLQRRRYEKLAGEEDGAEDEGRDQKTGMDLQEEKGLKHMWKEMVNTSPTSQSQPLNSTACFSFVPPPQASLAAPCQKGVQWQTPCVRTDKVFNILRSR